jgi:peptide/nickel transport system permease protein
MKSNGLKTEPVGSETAVSLVNTNKRVNGKPPESLFRQRLRRLLRGRFGLIMTLLCVGIILVAIFAPKIAPYDPFDVNPSDRLLSPSQTHLFGTDDLGRDVFSRIIYGARISIRIAVITVVFSVGIGLSVGTIAGYAGGITDQLVMRITDIFLAFPALILAMALTAALGPSVENAAIALGLVWWPGYARLIRGEILSIKNELFVEAGYAIGLTHFRILRDHILPNALDPILVRVTLTGGNAILMGAALSFIGLGAQPPEPEWGLMVALARRFMIEAWWYPTIVGLVIFLTVLIFTLAGDAIQEAIFPERD